jgi:PEGA domain
MMGKSQRVVNWTGVMIAGMLLACSGCATALRGEKQAVKFNTDPQGASVAIGKGVEVVTPSEVKLTRKDKHEVTISKPGYRTVKFDLTARWDGASIAGFALPGGSVSVATDRATGADLQFYKLETIKLIPSADPNAPALEMVHYQGRIYSREDYARVMEEERKYRENFPVN